jgi:hypothetical protein
MRYRGIPGSIFERFDREKAMLNLSHEQRGLLDYLAERVRELVATAHTTSGTVASSLMAEAEELTALRAGIVDRYRDADAQLQLPLEIKAAA